MEVIPVLSTSNLIISDVSLDKEFVDKLITLVDNNRIDLTASHTNLKANFQINDLTETGLNLDPLVDVLMEEVEASVHSLIGNNISKEMYELVNVWAAKYHKDDYTTEHTHLSNGSVVSFVYFMLADENSSPLVFKDKFLNIDLHQIKPKTGRMVIFPSHLFHYVPVIKHGGDRYIISGNLKFNVSRRNIKGKTQ